jgi:enoyl-CoA hydratase
MSDPVSFEIRDDVAILRLDDGKANAVSPALLDAMGACLDEVERADKAILLLGRPGRFSAGFDLGIMRDGGPDAARTLVTGGARLALRLARHPAPVVVGCTGHALAMGAVLLMAADIRVGATGAFKIGFNEVAIGLATPVFLMEMARDRISKRHLLRATVMAEIYDPEGALDVGFFDRVVAPGLLEEEAFGEAARLGALPRAAYLRTRSLARNPTLEHIEATLEKDMDGAFPTA